jgi:hypothetical protein
VLFVGELRNGENMRNSFSVENKVENISVDEQVDQKKTGHQLIYPDCAPIG